MTHAHFKHAIMQFMNSWTHVLCTREFPVYLALITQWASQKENHCERFFVIMQVCSLRLETPVLKYVKCLCVGCSAPIGYCITDFCHFLYFYTFYYQNQQTKQSSPSLTSRLPKLACHQQLLLNIRHNYNMSHSFMSVSTPSAQSFCASNPISLSLTVYTWCI